MATQKLSHVSMFSTCVMPLYQNQMVNILPGVTGVSSGKQETVQQQRCNIPLNASAAVVSMSR
jgi:hypothetical protein